MKFNIHGDKIQATEAIKNYIREKIGKLDKYFESPDNTTANVVVKVRGINQIIEVTIPIGSVILRGEESHKDLYAAIDLVSEKIERQIRKNKTRLKKRNNKDIINNFVLDFESDNNENESENEEKMIVKRKVIEMKPMSEEEAILQMNLLGHDFFVFKDAEDSSICVLYRRKDNNYGIIRTN
ncbi:MAG: ribosome-associated translation inhibitor RaiA [Mollicutes bacterium]|nr:ribosome-associated translation inhibitor RaiA [Mollicutes bacterium]